MNYEEAMGYITDTYKFGSKMGLERIKRLLELLGNPQKGLKYVHIAGTNGKGSTTAYISTVLMEAGYKTGIFISPFIQRFNERIRINKEEISGEDIAKYIVKIKDMIGVMVSEGSSHPTEFEIITAMGFMHYAENNCDIVVLETGLGGIIDSTNIIDDSVVSVITTIAFDHQQYLGNTITEIAEKKAGIIKRNGSVVIYPQSDEVMEVFLKECQVKNAKLYKVLSENVNIISSDTTSQAFDFEEHKGLQISLLGEHQIYNASLAVKAIEVLKEKGFHITDENLRNGLFNTKWPGRFEIVFRNPEIIIDGAHNVQGANNLAENLKKYFPDTKFVFIVGILSDKDFEHMLSPFFPIAEKFIAVAPDYYRAIKANDLKAYLEKFHDNVISFDTVKGALDYVTAEVDKNKIICAFGSLYYIGEIRDYFNLV